MKNLKNAFSFSSYFFRIVLPTLLAIFLFVSLIFSLIIPTLKKNMIDGKKEMILELTQSAWSILEDLDKKQTKGLISKENAQKEALELIKSLRYGHDQKDYFWVTDMSPRMLMHPYRPELDHKDISDYSDPNGKKLFIEAVQVVNDQTAGYIEYMWQWKDDPDHIVPKLSFVKGFQPWGWIIGTGIYIEDVNTEIRALTSRLLIISITIITIISILLVFIMHQSLKSEHLRQTAQDKLLESKERYQKLVEAATDGTMILLNNKFIFSNKPMCNMLGYTLDEFLKLELNDIFEVSKQGELSPVLNTPPSDRGVQPPTELETKLIKKDGKLLPVLVINSEITLAGKTGQIIIAKDISGHKKIEEELGESQEKYNTLINKINTGVFRTTFGINSTCIELNQAAKRIFGFEEQQEENLNLFDLFIDSGEKKVFLDTLSKEGFVKDKFVLLKKKDGSVSVNSISAVLVKGEDGITQLCDGIVEDITEQKKDEELKEKLIGELQTALVFLNEPIKEYTRDIMSCEMNTSIRDVASIMTQNNYGAIIVKADSDKYIGIVTDRDFKERAVAGGMNIDGPIFEIMTSPLVTISERSLIFDAILKMHEKGVKHLAVNDGDGKIRSVLSYARLLDVQRHSSSFLMNEINRVNSVNEIKRTYDRLPLLVKAMVDSGVKARHITRVISDLSDTIITKIISFVLNELGPEPVPFSFIALGSVGRKEQTLLTDQDNAIIYEDPPEKEREGAESYFQEMGERVCNYLHQVGYTFCKGDVMAKNPKWCQPISVWEKNFSDWINTGDPQDLLEINIFFDFRSVFGQQALADRLRKHLHQTSKGRAVFFQNLARNVLLYKPPIGFLGKILVSSSGEHPDTFNIKNAMMPIISFARIYALQNGIEETNTLERIHHLFAQQILTKSSHEEVVLVYNFLMKMRFRHQASLLYNGMTPDNYINPDKLTRLDNIMLKKTLEQISDFQTRLRFDFTGTS